MRTDYLTAALAEIQKRCMYNIIYPNVDTKGQRRRDDVPWTGLIVFGDLGPTEGHECFVYEQEEGCIEDGHSNYEFVAWIDHMGRIWWPSQ
jgi:hypothetical protein